MAYTGSTRQDLIAVVLENLGVLAAGQSASVEDAACVNRRVDPTLATLGKREVLTGLSADTLDPGVFLLVADIVAYACRTPFGITGNKADELKAKADAAEAELKAVSRQYSPTAANLGFDPVQNTLEVLGVVAPGQDASPQDRGIIVARAAALLADLSTRGLVSTSDITKVNVAQQRHLSTMLVAACAPSFGIVPPALDAFVADATAAEQALREMGRQLSPYAAGGGFDPIRNTLEALGVVALGQDPTSQDRGVVTARAAALLVDLQTRGLVQSYDITQINVAQQRQVSTMLTAFCAPSFGIVPPALDAFLAESAKAEQSLREMGRQLSPTAAAGPFDVVRHVLETLRVVEAGQDPTLQDRGVVSARIPPMLADLRARDITTFLTIDKADTAQLRHLATILAASCAPAFGVTGDALAALITLANAAEQALRDMARQLDNGVGTSGVFDPIQAVLEMLGVVAPGQSGSDKDRAVVTARVQPLLLELYGRDICGVVDLALLSTELQKPFTRLLAADVALLFPKVPAARLALLQGMVAQAEASLRYQSFVYDAAPPLRVERFWGHRHGCAPLGFDIGSC